MIYRYMAATKERTEAPTKEPIEAAPLAGPGAGAGTPSSAIVAARAAAARTTARATFFICVADFGNKNKNRKKLVCDCRKKSKRNFDVSKNIMKT